MGNDFHARPFSPYLQLVHRGSPKCVCGGQKHFLAPGPVKVRQLANTGGLAGAVHTDNESYGEKPGLFQGKRLRGFQPQADLGFQGLKCGVGGGRGLVLDRAPRMVNEFLCRRQTDIPHDEIFLDFLPCLFGDAFGIEDIPDAAQPALAGLGKAGAQARAQET